jgi:putative redox protein
MVLGGVVNQKAQTTYLAGVEWKEGNAFQGTTANGAFVVMDSARDAPKGASPMELVLLALAGCTAMDVVSILRKARVPIRRFSVSARAQRSPAFPRVFISFHLHYALWTPSVSHRTALERAVRLSREKYCSVGLMLEKTAPITYDLEVFTDA